MLQNRYIYVHVYHVLIILLHTTWYYYYLEGDCSGVLHAPLRSENSESSSVTARGSGPYPFSVEAAHKHEHIYAGGAKPGDEVKYRHISPNAKKERVVLHRGESEKNEATVAPATRSLSTPYYSCI